MFSNASSEVSLDTPCRTLTAIRGDRSDSKFLAGSSSNDKLELHCLRYDAEVQELVFEESYSTAESNSKGSSQAICTSPSDPRRVWTAAAKELNLWRLPQAEDLSATSTTLHCEITVTNQTTSVVDFAWKEEDADTSIVWVNRKGVVTQFDLPSETVVRTCNTPQSKTAFDAPLSPPQIAWDPHTSSSIAVTYGSYVHLLDWRSADQNTILPTGTVDRIPAHRLGVTALDFNPNKPYTLSTAGQDGSVKVWDTRAAKHPLLVARGGQSHWTTQVQYNPFHDQLVLSAGTDAVTTVWRWSTGSSAPLVWSPEDDEDEEQNDDENHDPVVTAKGPNAPIALHGQPQQQQCPVQACWSQADAWMYVTLETHHGKVTLHHVPSKEKYKILL